MICEPLNQTAIQQGLSSAGFHKPVQVHVLGTVDSTNRFLKDLPANNMIQVCCAETQTQGRGRFGHTWHSPLGENIYCSIRWPFDCDLSRLSGLGLIVSMAVLAILSEIDGNIRIKWPNDLLWHEKKLCGNLVEVVGRSSVVIGIGLNVNSNTQLQPLFDKPWCSLYEITGKNFDRNTLIAQLIIKLETHLTQFIKHGFASFIPAWQQADYLCGKFITVSQATGHLSGKAHGVNDLGQLILIDKTGVTHYLSSGDTSLNLNRKT